MQEGYGRKEGMVDVAQGMFFSSLGLVHTCRLNCQLVSIDKVLRLFIDKLQVWRCDKKLQIMLDLFHNSLPTKLAIGL